ncbi:putative membrane protein [Halanaeroarchaeum sp. HSR-CO]|uniref:hypothetical protein n=1 Tax=Halanaeroarchaeum sp. HSR-CO TaxID=2866382 RepID=UPI00217E8D9B|nr:hypothetical protein [Halanaeroarchaeum sp. HSR-CO]UWG49127.1 putative membrane protein [Halanaeroarchaeum sp. HSR-CO]
MAGRRTPSDSSDGSLGSIGDDGGDGIGHSDWRNRVEQLLYAGEEVRLRVGRTQDEIVVTSHRLLAFTPERDGSNFHAVDLPNVEAISTESSGRFPFVSMGAKALLAGIVIVAAGLVIDFDRLAASIPIAGTDAVGASSILGMLDGLRTVLAVADVVLLGIGGLLAFVGLTLLAAYWLTRRTEVVVAVAGDEDVHLDRDSFGDSDLAKIETALERR